VTLSDSRRPPYGAALVVFALVLTGYVLTLAPTVTFWDAGELIAAGRILGIPHPPGTPLFVLIAHVWGMIVPAADYAWRLNLLSACFGALAAGLWFLLAQETLRRALPGVEGRPGDLVAYGGGIAAALISAFTSTHWQNSNESEVYSVAVFTIALICWLVFRWRVARGTDRATHLLLLIVYLGGISMGNHLLALLVGPAVVAALVVTLLETPADDAGARRREWAQVAVLAGIWALLIGLGLGSTALIILGAICFIAAASIAAAAGALPFALLTLAISVVGVTTYLFLFIRAGQKPFLNEADPSTFDALLAVIRRAQYPPRTPLDDPTVLHGPGNPGRTLGLIWLQLQNYIQYFDWQWVRGLPGRIAGVVPVRVLGTVLFTALGIRGLIAQRRGDRAGWWLLFSLFLITGLGLVVYMNFKPGASLGYDQYPDSNDHEVRERDYFFVVSFLVWGVWAGIGLATLMREAMARAGRGPLRLAAAGLFAIALIPIAGNLRAADRRHGADARLAADFAYNLLNSVPPYGILFTYGDNDTFPLWWAQEVAGIRRDVTIVCLALANTDWYARQLRENPARPFDEATAPAIWKGRSPVRPDWPLHSMSDAEIDAAVPQQLAQAVTVNYGPFIQTYPAGSVFYTNDFVVARVIQQNLGRRPIAWSVTTGRDFLGLDPYLVQQGLVFRVESAVPDSTAPGLDSHRLAGPLLDVPVTDRLVWETYRYGPMLERPTSGLDVTSRSFASTLSLPAAQLAYAYQSRGDLARMVANLERAGQLSPNPAIAAALAQLRAEQLGAPPDSN
jgi:hypothetical protein